VLFSNRSGAYASLGSYWEALADAEKAIALRPDWSKGFSRKGAALYGLGRYAEALNTYDAGLAVEPGSQQMGQAVADVRQKLQAARSLFEAVVEGATDRVAQTLQHGLHPDGYATEEGVTALMIAAKLGSADLVSLLLKHGAKPSLKNKAGEGARDFAKRGGHDAVVKLFPVEEGKSSITSGASSLFAAAKGFANKAVQKAAAVRDDVARQGLGEDYDAVMKQREERKRREAADKVAEAQAAKRRTIEAAMRRKAEEDDLALIRLLSAQRAKEEKEKAIEASRAAEEARVRAAAQAVKEASDAEEARQLAAEAEREARANAFKLQGNDAFKENRFTDAVRLYSQAIEFDPSNSVLYSNRSGSLTACGSFEQALADADRCVALRPEWAKGHTRRASALHGMRRYLKAVKAYDDALRHEPGNEMLIHGRRQSSFALAHETD